MRILASRTPSDIPGSRPGSPSYSFEMMATKDLPDLIIDTYFLVRTWPTTSRSWGEVEGRETLDVLGNIPRLSAIMQGLDRLGELFGQDPPYATYELDAAGGAKLHVFDFTDAIGSLGGQDCLDDQYTIYVVMIDDRDQFRVYAGYRDFFFRRETVITEVDYQAPGVSECFRSSRAIGGVASCKPITDAPMGNIHLTDLETNDRIRVDVDLDTSEMFGHSGLLQLVTTETGYGPGSFMVNVIGTKSS